MELVIAIDVLPCDTTMYADVILPNSTYLERGEPNIYANGVNHDLGLVTRYPAIDPLYDTREAPDILLKMTEIISGKADAFMEAIEKLTGLNAASAKKKMAEKIKEGVKSPFSAACRDVAFEQAAEEAGITVKQLDTVLRDKGVLILENQGQAPGEARHALETADAQRKRSGGVLLQPVRRPARHGWHCAAI